METATNETNGKSRISLPTFGCEGCEQRKVIMGAGDWKVDLGIALILVALGILFWKVKIA